MSSLFEILESKIGDELFFYEKKGHRVQEDKAQLIRRYLLFEISQPCFWLVLLRLLLCRRSCQTRSTWENIRSRRARRRWQRVRRRSSWPGRATGLCRAGRRRRPPECQLRPRPKWCPKRWPNRWSRNRPWISSSFRTVYHWYKKRFRCECHIKQLYRQFNAFLRHSYRSLCS